MKKKPTQGMVRTVVSSDAYEDRYAAKLVKYIPVEVLAAFIPLVALADKVNTGRNPSEVWIWVTIGIGFFAVLGYSRWQATDQLEKHVAQAHPSWDDEKLKKEYDNLKPKPYFYLLALIAFAAWALATASPVRGVVGLTAAKSEWLVAAVTFLLPLVDATLAHFWKWVDQARSGPRAAAPAGPPAAGGAH